MAKTNTNISGSKKQEKIHIKSYKGNTPYHGQNYAEYAKTRINAE